MSTQAEDIASESLAFLLADSNLPPSRWDEVMTRAMAIKREMERQKQEQEVVDLPHKQPSKCEYFICSL